MSGTFRLLADDLTGALDTAAEVVGRFGPVRVVWDENARTALSGNAAIDSGTRERTEAEARDAVTALTPALAGAEIAFKKLDSLLRGHSLAELAACFTAGGWPSCVLAPAFPYQGRVTRGGRHYARAADGTWTPTGPDLAEALRALGVPARRGVPGEALGPGVSVFDATDDGDLDAVAALAQRAGRDVLWAGSGGLAGALGRVGRADATFALLPGPILGLFGSDQATTAGQLAACEAHWLTVPDGGADTSALVLRRLERNGVALVSLALPPETPRQRAASKIAHAFAGLALRLAPPGTLVVAGGETLRGLCDALGASGLDVQGAIVPGFPRSVMRGGAWDGVTVVSKSGAFGHPNLLRDLLRANALERTTP